MRYLLNSAVITLPGTYVYHHVDATTARTWMQAGPWESRIGYTDTALALTELSGQVVPVNRITTQMQVDDQALVFRLVFPEGSSRLDPERKGRLTQEFIAAHCEVGLLTRIA